MTAPNKKFNDCFAGYVVHRDPVKQISINAAVLNYVLQCLLNQSCATGDDGVKVNYKKFPKALAKVPGLSDWK